MIAGDELTTAIVTNQLARDIDAAYATGEQAALSHPARGAVPAARFARHQPAARGSTRSCSRWNSCTPASTPPAERADLELFIRQWAAVRDLLSGRA